MSTISEYKLASIQPKKTHPLVLVAATGLTIFSILGSAAITGLIPVQHNVRDDFTADKTPILTVPALEATPTMQLNQTKNSRSGFDGSTLDRKPNRSRHPTDRIMGNENQKAQSIILS